MQLVGCPTRQEGSNQLCWFYYAAGSHCKWLEDEQAEAAV